MENGLFAFLTPHSLGELSDNVRCLS